MSYTLDTLKEAKDLLGNGKIAEAEDRLADLINRLELANHTYDRAYNIFQEQHCGTNAKATQRKS
jgi:hypothetical protein